MGYVRREILKEIDVINARLALYLDAESKILEGAQSYTIGSKTLQRANLKEIREMIDNLILKRKELELKLKGQGLRKSYRVVIRDL